MSAQSFKKPNAKEIVFLKTWKQTRLAKMKYILTNAFAWGATMALLANLAVVGFSVMDLEWRNLGLAFLVFLVGGFGLGAWLYSSQERRYQEVLSHAPECLED